MISMEPGLSPPTTMRRRKKERRGWRKKKRKLALPNAIPGFVAVGILRRRFNKCHGRAREITTGSRSYSSRCA
jgi:hypothetical protein